MIECRRRRMMGWCKVPGTACGENHDRGAGRSHFAVSRVVNPSAAFLHGSTVHGWPAVVSLRSTSMKIEKVASPLSSAWSVLEQMPSISARVLSVHVIVSGGGGEGISTSRCPACLLEQLSLRVDSAPDPEKGQAATPQSPTHGSS